MKLLICLLLFISSASFARSSCHKPSDIVGREPLIQKFTSGTPEEAIAAYEQFCTDNAGKVMCEKKDIRSIDQSREIAAMLMGRSCAKVFPLKNTSGEVTLYFFSTFKKLKR